MKHCMTGAWMHQLETVIIQTAEGFSWDYKYNLHIFTLTNTDHEVFGAVCMMELVSMDADRRLLVHGCTNWRP